MGKGEDAITRRRNKKKVRKQQSKVSNRIASLIAAKKRRLSGKRRNCQGMCFSLPTPEDPFMNKYGEDFPAKKLLRSLSTKLDKNKAKQRKQMAKGVKPENDVKEEGTVEFDDTETDDSSSDSMLDTSDDDTRQKGAPKLGNDPVPASKMGQCLAARDGLDYNDYVERPSKYLIMCLNSIQNAMEKDGFFSSEMDKPFLLNSWGLDFWKCFSVGKNMLETGGVDSTMEQIAWMASTAADAISRKEKEGHEFNSPFLLFIVPSREKAAKVRQICKPLKPLGIHTVSLHSGAPLDHQYYGLKRCEPEFIVSTPERLLELVALEAIDLTGVPLLVIDGLQAIFESGYMDSVKSIKELIITNPPQTLIFSDCSSPSTLTVAQNLLGQFVSVGDSCDSQDRSIFSVNDVSEE